ncbi:PaaI family thioesterase [Nocardioides acrostichi]|uniref:PaaI family thioesterase n=1 Tax=Nocardioides acrostichi TaxID=2784339 RepID=A0A930V4Y5_9ACTN|nr:PaaI family thioesterase [Nocardioides acrostichi]MBF4163830.1 PaaI family thioesterase [Nocardioides acrostichi]
MMNGFHPEDISDEELDRQRDLYGPFTDVLRDLVDAGIRTEVGEAEIHGVQVELEAIVARLRERQIPGAYGVRYTSSRRSRAWGNSVVGVRNAIAPPLRVHWHPDATGEVWADFELGAAYEGPPGLVHGGICSLLLDQLLGESAGCAQRAGMTATLTLTYRAPTPLGPLRGEAWVDRHEDRKTWCRGHLIGPEGVTVEAEGLFIQPRTPRGSDTPAPPD